MSPKTPLDAKFFVAQCTECDINFQARRYDPVHTCPNGHRFMYQIGHPTVGSIPDSITDQWGKGLDLDHHPIAIKFIKAIQEQDTALAADLRSGGDGDYGETLAYLLSEWIKQRGCCPCGASAKPTEG